MRVLLTGHNGYIGAVLGPMLKEHGHDVVGIDTYFYEECVFRQVPDLPAIRKDLRDVLPDELAGFDAIVHLAALSNDPLGDLNPKLTSEINHAASVRLASLAKQAGVPRFLFSSSCSIYGAAQDGISTEESTVEPLTPYALSKIRTEEDLSQLADASFSPVILRNATVYGVSPKLRVDLVLNNLVGWAYTTGHVRILSDGTPWRPIVHVEDLSKAMVSIFEAPRDLVHNQTFNVGVNEENYQVRELADIVGENVPSCSIAYAGDSGPDKRNYRVDFSKFRKTFPDFTPVWNARQGAKQLYDEYHAQSMTREQFQSRRYIRINQLRHLLDKRLLGDDLRWHKPSAPRCG